MSDRDRLLHGLVNDYLAGASGARLSPEFAAWAIASGFKHECRKGVDVALDETGRVVAFVDRRLPARAMT